MYDELVKRLRNCASDTVEDCAGCPYQGGYKGTYCMNGLIAEAADAIEELQKRLSRAEFRLCDWCGVCPDDKRDIEDCEIAMIGNEYTSVKWATCQPEPPKEET